MLGSRGIGRSAILVALISFSLAVGACKKGGGGGGGGGGTPTLGSVAFAGTPTPAEVQFSYTSLRNPSTRSADLTLRVEWTDSSTNGVGGPFPATLIASGTSPGSISQTASNEVTIPVSGGGNINGTFNWSAVADVRAQAIAAGIGLPLTADVTITVTPLRGTRAGTPVSTSPVVQVLVPAGNTPPAMSQSPTLVTGQPVTTDAVIQYNGLGDLDGDSAILAFQWTINGAAFFPMTLTATSLTGSQGSISGNELTVNGSTTSSGTVTWDADGDILGAGNPPGTYSVTVRVTPRDAVAGTGTALSTNQFQVQLPSTLVASVSTAGRRGNISVSVTLDDLDGPNVNIAVRYRVQDPNNPALYTEADATISDPTGTLTINGNDITNLAPYGTLGTHSPQTYSFLWDSLADLGQANTPAVTIVINATQAGVGGTVQELSQPFVLLNLPIIDRVITASSDPFFAPEVGPGETFRIEGRNFGTNEPSMAVLINNQGFRVIEGNSDAIVARSTGTVNTGFLQVATGATLDNNGNLTAGSLSDVYVIKIRGNDRFSDGGLQTSFPTRLPQIANDSNHAAFGDLDGDGDLDIVVATQDRNLVFINQNVNERLVARQPQAYDIGSLPAVDPAVTGTATGGTATTLVDSAAAFPTLRAGSEVEITGGTGVGDVRTITSNTGIELTVSTAWSATPDATSTYAVRQPRPELVCYRVRSLIGRNDGPFTIINGTNDQFQIRVTLGYSASTDTDTIDLNPGAGRRILSVYEVVDAINSFATDRRYEARALNSSRLEIVPRSPADTIDIMAVANSAYAALGFSNAYSNMTGGGSDVLLGEAVLSDPTQFDGTAADLASLINGQVAGLANGSSGALAFETPDIFVLGCGSANQLLDLDSTAIDARMEGPYPLLATNQLTLEIGGESATFAFPIAPASPPVGGLTAGWDADEIVTTLNARNAALADPLPLRAEIGAGGRVRLLSTNNEPVHIVYADTSSDALDAFAFLGRFVKPHARGIGQYDDETDTAFPLGSVPIQQDFTTEVALFDCDEDGDLDVFFANSREQNRLLVNQGGVQAGTMGVFSEVTTTQLPQIVDATHGVAVGDLDNDGDLDLVLANEGPNTILLNGSGTFREAPNALFVGDDNAFGDPIDNDGGAGDDVENFDSFTTDVAVADFDADGFLDIAFANLSRDTSAPNQGPQILRRSAAGNPIGGFTLAEPLYSDVTDDLLPLVRTTGVDETPLSNFSVAWGYIDDNEGPDLIIASPASALPGTPTTQPNTSSRVFINTGALDLNRTTDWDHGLQGSYFPWVDLLPFPTGDLLEDVSAMVPATSDAFGFIPAPRAFDFPDSLGEFHLMQFIFQKLDNDDFDNFATVTAATRARVFSDHTRMAIVASDGQEVASVPIRSDYILMVNDLDSLTSPQLDGQDELYVRGILAGTGATVNSETSFTEPGTSGENPYGHWSPWRSIDANWDFIAGTALPPPSQAEFVPTIPATDDPSLGGAIADVDDDGDLDVFIANRGQDRLIMNGLQQ